MSTGMFSEGVSTRAKPATLHPVFHIVVSDHGWKLWCTSSNAREEAPGQYPEPHKLCKECRMLAAEAIEDGTMSPSEVPFFSVEYPCMECGPEADIDPNGNCRNHPEPYNPEKAFRLTRDDIERRMRA